MALDHPWRPVANRPRACDQTGGRRYFVPVTEPAPEPTLADVMEVMKAGFSQLSTALATANARLEELDAKVDTVETSLRHEIRDSESRLGRRIDDVQNVVRTLKADLAAHLNDPNAHGHAA